MNYYYSQLGKAIELAVHAHRGQKDRGDKPYILHPLYIMGKFPNEPKMQAIAVLHDVIEDCYMDCTDLFDAGFSNDIVDVVEKLTRHKDEDYLQTYIPRICKNKDCMRVKIEDLKHNLDISRLKEVTTKDVERMNKYIKALFIIKCSIFV